MTDFLPIGAIMGNRKIQELDYLVKKWPLTGREVCKLPDLNGDAQYSKTGINRRAASWI